MIYVRFHPDIRHDEVCGFEEFNVSLQSLGECGAAAVGFTGHRADDRVSLCSAHFNYTRKLAGVHDSEVGMEVKK